MRKLIIFISLSLLFITGAHSSEPARRIISLAPSITKSLYLMGAADEVSAVTIYCTPEAKDKEKIGTILEPNIEKIVSLKPDLVIATKEGNRPETVWKLKKLGINVFVMETHNTFEDICSGFLALGKQIGREEAAGDIIARAREKVSAVRKKIKNEKPPRVFWEIGAQPLFTVSRHSFVNDFIEYAGGVNIFARLKNRYPQISREEVVFQNPDLIIIITMGDVTDNEITAWKKFTSLSAVKSNRIYALREPVFTDPTPASFAQGLEIIAKLLHPNAK